MVSYVTTSSSPASRWSRSPRSSTSCRSRCRIPRISSTSPATSPCSTRGDRDDPADDRAARRLQRTMLSYFDPRGNADKQATLMRGAVTGNFSGDPAYAMPRSLRSSSPPAGHRGARRGRGLGVDGTSLGLDGADLRDHAARARRLLANPGSPGLCVRDAVYFTWRGAADQDAVIAIDPERPGSPNRAVVGHRRDRPHLARGDAMPNLVSAIPGRRGRSSMADADVDGDRALELVVAFSRPPMGAPAGAQCSWSAPWTDRHSPNRLATTSSRASRR